MLRIQKRLVGSFAEAELSGMRAIVVVFSKPLIHINLNILKVGVEFFSKEDGVAFVLHGSIEALANAICLRVIGFGLGMVNVFNA